MPPKKPFGRSPREESWPKVYLRVRTLKSRHFGVEAMLHF